MTKIILTEEQKNILTNMNLWLKTKTPNSLFALLEGQAGTGKTTIIKEFLSNPINGLCIAAPTHKAAEVLSKITGNIAYTIHLLLGLQPNMSLEEFRHDKVIFDKSSNPLIDYSKVVIIDEASQINKYLLDYIFDVCIKRGIKLLFIGDDKQLPPVGETISNVFLTDKIKHKFKLTTILRQSGDNPIIDIYSNIISNISEPNINDLYITNDLKNDNSDGIYFFNNIKNLLESLKEYYYDMFNKSEFNKIKTITWSNKSVSSWNFRIRNLLFENIPLKELQSKIFEKEILTSYNTIKNSKKEIIIQNSSDYLIHDIDEFKNKEGIFGKKLMISKASNQNTSDYKSIFLVDLYNEENYISYYNILEDLKNKALTAKTPSTRKYKWFDFYKFRNSNLISSNIINSETGKVLYNKDLDFAYSSTIHKVQGSTYENICIIEQNILLNENIEERNKMIYTALTRARKKTFVFTDRIT